MYTALARFISFISAILLSAVVLVYPVFIVDENNHVNHSLLSLFMWGIAAGFIHGVGFDPISRFWKVIASPFISWTVMLACLIYFLFINNH